MEFVFEKDWFKLISSHYFNEWETVILIDGVKSTVLKSKENLLEPAHKRKIDKELMNYFRKEVRVNILLEIIRAFNEWEEREKIEVPEIIETSGDALKILDNDPLGFLLKELNKIHPGDFIGLTLYIYSLMSLNDAVNYLIHIETLGASGAGKSHGQKTCKKLLPVQMQHHIDSVSAKSLIYYSKDHSLKKKLIIIDDATEKDIEMLKHVGNNGLEPFTYSSVIDGAYVEFKADASPLIWFSKVSPLEDEGGQVSSRFLVFNVDESPEQRKKILDAIKRDDEAVINPLCREVVNECINLGVNKIVCGNFDIPNEDKIGFRDANFFKALIKCSAVLNHRKRIINDGVLYCNEEDKENMKRLWNNLAVFNNNKLSKKYAMVYDLIPDSIEGISSTKLRELSGLPKTSLHRVLESLEFRGLVRKMIIGKTGYYYRD